MSQLDVLEYITKGIDNLNVLEASFYENHSRLIKLQDFLDIKKVTDLIVRQNGILEEYLLFFQNLEHKCELAKINYTHLLSILSKKKADYSDLVSLHDYLNKQITYLRFTSNISKEEIIKIYLVEDKFLKNFEEKMVGVALSLPTEIRENREYSSIISKFARGKWTGTILVMFVTLIIAFNVANAQSASAKSESFKIGPKHVIEHFETKFPTDVSTTPAVLKQDLNYDVYFKNFDLMASKFKSTGQFTKVEFNNTSGKHTVQFRQGWHHQNTKFIYHIDDETNYITIPTNSFLFVYSEGNNISFNLISYNDRGNVYDCTMSWAKLSDDGKDLSVNHTNLSTSKFFNP